MSAGPWLLWVAAVGLPIAGLWAVGETTGSVVTSSQVIDLAWKAATIAGAVLAAWYTLRGKVDQHGRDIDEMKRCRKDLEDALDVAREACRRDLEEAVGRLSSELAAATRDAARFRDVDEVAGRLATAFERVDALRRGQEELQTTVARLDERSGVVAEIHADLGRLEGQIRILTDLRQHGP